MKVTWCVLHDNGTLVLCDDNAALAKRAADHAQGHAVALPLHRLFAAALADEGAASEVRCADCGEGGERTGHMGCQYPQDRS